MRRTAPTLILLLLVCTAFKCGEGEAIVPIPNLPFKVTSPKGVRIEAVAPVPLSAQNAVDAGISIQIEKTNAFYKGEWKAMRRLSDYRVIFTEPTATNMDGSPAIIVRGIQSAGTVRGVAKDGWANNEIILPHQGSTNWRYLDYLRDSARNESEHSASWENDEAVFYYFTGANDIHPFFP